MFPEDFVAEEFELGLLVVVDGDEDDAAVGKETFGDAQALGHER